MTSRSPSKSGLLAVIAIIAVATVASWWWTRVPDGPGEPVVATAPTTPAGPSAKEIVARKRTARADVKRSVEPSGASGTVVVAGSREPVAGAQVLLSPRGMPSEAMQGSGEPTAPITAVTDAGGQWKVTGVAPGDYNVGASARGYQPGVLDKVRLSPGTEHEGLVVEVAEGGHRLHGVVSDLGGGPVSDVLVSVVELDTGSLTSFSRTAWPAMTDAEGRYELFVPTGNMTVSTWHPDYVTEAQMVKVPEGGTSLNLSLLPGGAIAGVVRARPGGEPVAGARVRVSGGQAGVGAGASMMGMGGGMTAALTGSSVRSDAQGRFRIPGLSAGTLTVQATAQGMSTSTPMEVPMAIAEEVDGVEVWLDSSFSISGFVVQKGTDGEQGVDGVMVMAMSMSPPGMLQASGPSQSDGFFQIDGAKPGTYMLMAMGERHVPNMMQQTAVVSDSDVNDVLLELESGVYVEGQVSPPGEADISVDLSAEGMSLGSMMQSAANAMVRARAAEDGSFRMGPMTPKTKLALAATSPDGARGMTDVDLGDEDVTGVTIALTPRARIKGTVRDGQGGVVRGVTVEVDPVKRDKSNIQISMGQVLGSNTTTGDDGRYVKTGLDAGEYRVRVEESSGIAMRWYGEEGDAARTPKTVTVADGETETLDLVVDAHDGVIRGRVVGPDGEAVLDAFVRALPRMTREEMRRSAGVPDRAKGGAEVRVEVGGGDEAAAQPEGQVRYASRPVLTDADGRFEIERLRRGSYDVVAEAAQGASRGVAESIQTGAQARVQLAVLSTLTCEVTENGAPATSFTAELRGPTRRSVTVDDPGGLMEARRLRPGSYEVSVKTSNAFGSVTVKVLEGEPATCELDLVALGAVKGLLVDGESGKPIAGMVVLVQDASEDMSAAAAALLTGEGATTSGSGTFNVDGIAPGRVSVIFMNRAAALMGGSPLVGLATAVLKGGETLDLGTVRGWQGKKVDEAQQGTLGWTLSVDIYEERPGTDNSASDGKAEELPPGAKPLRLWVSAMTVDGPAQQAGVKLGDEVVLVDGATVESLGAFPAQMRLASGYVTTGQTVQVGLSRAGEDVAVTLTATPAPTE